MASTLRNASDELKMSTFWIQGEVKTLYRLEDSVQDPAIAHDIITALREGRVARQVSHIDEHGRVITEVFKRAGDSALDLDIPSTTSGEQP